MKSELQRIPGVGTAMAKDLQELGYLTIDSLKGQNPEEMYQRRCIQQGCQLDPCVLYVYRCAVYFAQTPNPDPEKLKWWYWKEHTL